MRIYIIVTIYNSSRTLELALSSLAAQIYSDAEFILVNDGSPDKDDERIAKAYVSLNHRFKYICHDSNKGTAKARETGITLASGEIIGFLDSDDFLIKGSLDTIKTTMMEGVDVAVFNYITFKNEHDIDAKLTASSYSPAVTRTIGGLELFSLQVRRIHRPYYLRIDWWNKFYRRDYLISLKIPFPFASRNEGTLSMIASINAISVAVVDKVLFLTRTDPGSLSRSYSHSKLEDCSITSRVFFESTNRLLAQNELYDYSVSLFGFIIFNLNLKALLKSGSWPSEIYRFRDFILSDNWTRRFLLEYLNQPDRRVERIIFATLNHKCSKSIIGQISKTDFFPALKVFGSPLSLKKKHGDSSKETISVITITKDLYQEQRISSFERMIKSVQSQTFGRNNIEHIIIDAASGDGTQEYLSDLCKRNKIDLVISEKDKGIYNAMNKGLSAFNGSYFIFINSDDYLPDDSLESLHQSLVSSQAHYAFADAIKVDVHGKKVGAHNGNIDKVFFGSPYCHQTLLCKTPMADAVRFDESFRITMWQYALSLYKHNFSHVKVEKALAYFQVGGISTNPAHSEIFRREQYSIKDRLCHEMALNPSYYQIVEEAFRMHPKDARKQDMVNQARALLDRLLDSSKENSIKPPLFESFCNASLRLLALQ